MTKLIVRSAENLDEVEQARLLTNRSWLSTYSALIGEVETQELISKKHSVERFHQQFATSPEVFLVALMDNEVVGNIWGFQEEGFYVDRLHVAPDKKGHGIGSRLLSATENLLPKNSRLWLDVLMGNDSAMAFYERVGFKRCGETDACGGLAGIPAVIFEKTV